MTHALAFTCAVAFAAAAHAASIQHDTAVRHIDRAGELLFSERSGNIPQGIASLLDAVTELTAGNSAQATVRTSVQLARREILGGRAPVDARVGGLLRDAYKALPGSTPFQPPPAEDVEELLAELKRRLSSARSLATTGNVDESARLLLGIALAIVTPIQQ